MNRSTVFLFIYFCFLRLIPPLFFDLQTFNYSFCVCACVCLFFFFCFFCFFLVLFCFVFLNSNWFPAYGKEIGLDEGATLLL